MNNEDHGPAKEQCSETVKNTSMEKDSRMAKINYHLRRENKASKTKAPPQNCLINLRWNE